MTRQSTTGPLASGTLRTRTHLTALAAILCATAALAGCSSGDETTATESTAPIVTMPALPASSAPAGPETTVKKTVLDVYQGYWREMQAYYADRDGTTADLKQYAASEALASAENDAEYAHGRGRIYIGPVVVSKSTVTGTDLGSETPKVMLSSCLDVSRWRPVIADTRKPVGLPTNRLTKYLIASTLEKWPQGWRVVRDEPQDKRC